MSADGSWLKNWITSAGLAILTANAAAVPAFPPLRMISMEGNFGGNIAGIKGCAPVTSTKNGVVQTTTVCTGVVPDDYVQRLKDNYVNMVGIKVSIFGGSLADPTVKVIYSPSSGPDYKAMYTFDDQDLINAITKFKQNGIDVYLSLVPMQHQLSQALNATCNTPQYEVDEHLFGDSTFPAEWNSSAWASKCINPSYWWWDPAHPDHAANVATFWTSYTQVAVKYAKLAQQLGVGMFAIGEESDRLFRTRSSPRFPNHFKSELSRLVAAVRAEYKGLVTYGQQVFVYLDHPEWWGLDFAASGYLFEDLGLDVVGLSAYFTLGQGGSTTRVLSIAELEAAWSKVFQQYLAPLQARNPGIPLIFTDTGTSNSVNAPSLPSETSAYVFSDANGNGIDDGMEQQANIYQALFNVNKANNYLVRGTNFFGLVIETGQAQVVAANDARRSQELRGKPAELIIRSTYRDLANFSSDCIFDWAERSYPEYFAPAGPASTTAPPYYFRYYPETESYLAASSADNHLWTVGRISGGKPVDLGFLSTFVAAAGCAQ